MCIVESSIPIAMMLLSWGWNARKVEAGGAGMNVVITYKLEQLIANHLESQFCQSLQDMYVITYLECHHVK